MGETQSNNSFLYRGITPSNTLCSNLFQLKANCNNQWIAEIKLPSTPDYHTHITSAIHQLPFNWL